MSKSTLCFKMQDCIYEKEISTVLFQNNSEQMQICNRTEIKYAKK